MDSNITVKETISSSFVSAGLRFDPLRSIDGELLRGQNGGILMSITATYRSVLTKDSFIDTTQ